MQEQKQRIKNNILIAKFMDLDWEQFLPIRNVNYLVNGNYYEAHELAYNISWDWLMPVIEKCLVGEAEQSEEISNTTIKNIYEGICNQNISFAYKSVIEFIKYYNLNK